MVRVRQDESSCIRGSCHKGCMERSAGVKKQKALGRYATAGGFRIRLPAELGTGGWGCPADLCTGYGEWPGFLPDRVLAIRPSIQSGRGRGWGRAGRGGLGADRGQGGRGGFGMAGASQKKNARPLVREGTGVFSQFPSDGKRRFWAVSTTLCLLLRSVASSLRRPPTVRDD
jgi:hypothetical protein